MRNVKLFIEYDGTDFHGSQFQPKHRTVQGVIETALFKLTGENIRIIAAGRTDTGVHALEHVANFHTSSDLSLEAIHKGLNYWLPDDIVIHNVEEAPETFHARFDAIGRQYRYVIALRERAVHRHYTWFVQYPLDVNKMKDATQHIIDKKNFASFCKSRSEVSNYICHVYAASWTIDGNFLTFHIHANRFLHNMVRIIVGTLTDVGRGFLSVKEFSDIIKAKNRKSAGRTAPAKGLFLEKIYYKQD